LPENLSGLSFHIEHIVARQHGGSDNAENLTLACPECNFHKDTNLSGVDPDSGNVTPLFHSRRDRWDDHFKEENANIIGKTDIGRTTAGLLEMNPDQRLRLRKLLSRLRET